MAFLGIVACSCDDFLDKDPYDRPATEIALSDIAGLGWAMNGTYDAMCGERYYGRLFVACSEYMGDDMKQKEDNGSNDTYGDVYRFTKGEETDEIDRFWEYCYETILRANNIIYYLPLSLDGTTEEKNELMGQALFVRALAHFDLVRMYGQTFSYTPDATHIGIPVVTRPLSVVEQPARDSVITVYKQVIDDLKTAVTLFPDSTFVSDDAKYGNTYAAQALLSRVYMYMGDYVCDNLKTGWENSAEWASQLLDDSNSPFSLIPASYYVESWATLVPSSESLFELAFTTSSTFGLGAFYFPDADEVSAEAVPTYDLMRLYEPKDIRINMFRILSSSGNVYTKKYPGSDGQVGLDNIKVIRLSEVYLNRAEAYANMGQLDAARADVNAIRNRAGLTDVSTSLMQDELLEEIYLERRRELAFEGHRFWDISRHHRDVERSFVSSDLSYAKIAYPSDQYVFPIPKEEVQANANMIQNEGYSNE